MLPAERAALTAGQLRRRFAELYLAAYEAGVDPAAVGVAEGKAALGPGSRIGPKARLRLTVAPDAGTTEEELLELLRARIERRFKPS
jgi:hypothetical protein